MRFALRNILSLLSPNVCELCGNELVDNENVVCAVCLSKIEPSHIHRQPDNRIYKRLPIHTPVGITASFTTYTRQSDIAILIRRAKYNNRPDIIRYFTAYFTRQLLADGVLNDIDALQPIPMHPLKRFLRGFNQTEEMAEEITAETQIPVISALKAVKRHSSQTKQDAIGRTTNIRGSFALIKPELIKGKHIAIIDDVTTTGATINEAIHTIMQANPSKISVITLAHTGKI